MLKRWPLLALLAAGLLFGLVGYMAGRATVPRAHRQALGRVAVALPWVECTTCRARGVTVLTGGDEVLLDANWYYTWSPKGADRGECEFVPMFRPGTLATAAAYSRTLAGRDVLAFNEPDVGAPPDSDGLTVGELVVQWHALEAALPWSRLVGPGLTNHCYGAACWSLAEWLDAYYTAYGTYPRLDALALHYYVYFDYDIRRADMYLTQPYRRTFGAWIDYMKTTLEERGYADLPLWLTEFGYQPLCDANWAWCPQPKEVAAGLRVWLGAIRDEPRIARFAWFGARLERVYTDPAWWPMSLVSPGGTLTAAGEVYRRY